MDERIGIWNLLHDGEITAISQQGNTVTMFVSIPYLRRRLNPMGDSFVLSLNDVSQLEFREFDGSAVTLKEQLDIGRPEILGTDSRDLPVAVDTTMGQMIVGFSSLALALDTGQPTDFQTIDHVARTYWTEWEANAVKPREPQA